MTHEKRKKAGRRFIHIAMKLNHAEFVFPTYGLTLKKAIADINSSTLKNHTTKIISRKGFQKAQYMLYTSAGVYSGKQP